MEYHPDVWIILKMSSEEYGDIYKILAGWYGGYLGGDSWQLNSGIESVTEESDDVIAFKGFSGSVYLCHKQTERFSGLTQSIYAHMVETATKGGASVEVIEYKDLKL
jgi:hypothetical protein